MPPDDARVRMWSDALELMARAERMQRLLFEPRRAAPGAPNWSPPVDMLETDEEVIVLAALPGVDPDAIDARIEGGALLIAGQRVLPAEARTAIIHRLELPQGRFERRIALPPGAYRSVSHAMANGCLVVRLEKA